MRFNKKYIRIVLFWGIPLGVGLAITLLRNKKENYLFLHGEFTIGYNLALSKRYVGGSKLNHRVHEISFDYIVNGKVYHAVDDSFIRNSRNKDTQAVTLGDSIANKKYLVLFNKNKPEEAMIYVDYPISDSVDYYSCIKQLQQMRKNE